MRVARAYYSGDNNGIVWQSAILARRNGDLAEQTSVPPGASRSVPLSIPPTENPSSVALDAVVFSDGEFVGPNNPDVFWFAVANNAQRELYNWLANRSSDINAANQAAQALITAANVSAGSMPFVLGHLKAHFQELQTMASHGVNVVQAATKWYPRMPNIWKAQ